MNVYQHSRTDTVHLVKGCNGAHEPVHLCMKCAMPLAKQTRIYRKVADESEKSFKEYNGRKGSSPVEEEPPHAKVADDRLTLSKSAVDLVNCDMPYVKAFISEDGLMLALKPVSGGEVSDDCLSARTNRISFGGIRKELNVDFNRYPKERFEVTWSEEKEMLIVDFSAK